MKLLPFPEAPMFLCYHSRAFPFGIVQANNVEDITKWACTKCINCVFTIHEPEHMFDMIVEDVWGSDEFLVTTETVNIEKYRFKQPKLSLRFLMRNIIEEGYYIFGLFNEKYIPGKSAFNTMDYIHDFLIIGYNEDNYISVGYLDNGRFELFEIPNKNMVDSLYKMNQDKIQFQIIKYNKDVIPKPNLDRMLEELKNYIASADQLNVSTPQINSFGIATMARLRDLFIDEVKNKGKTKLDSRYSRVLYEHKWVLSKLVECYLDEGERQRLLESATKNLKKAKCIHMLGYKMDLTGDGKLINRVEILMNEIISEELQYIPDLIETLNQKYLGDINIEKLKNRY